MSIRKKFTVEQILRILRDAVILLAEGQTVPVVSRKLGISERVITAGARSTAV